MYSTITILYLTSGYLITRGTVKYYCVDTKTENSKLSTIVLGRFVISRAVEYPQVLQVIARHYIMIHELALEQTPYIH